MFHDQLHNSGSIWCRNWFFIVLVQQAGFCFSCRFRCIMGKGGIIWKLNWMSIIVGFVPQFARKAWLAMFARDWWCCAIIRKLSYFVINPTTLPNTAIQAANSLRLLFFLFLLLSKKKHELPANWSSHQRKPWYWYFKFMLRCIFFLLSPCDMWHSGSDTTAGRLSCRATLTLTHHRAALRTLFPFRYHLEMPFVLQMMGV